MQKRLSHKGYPLYGTDVTRDRLQAALPRLQQQLKQAHAREYSEQWREDYAAVKAKRDKLAAELRERYPQLVDELVTLMSRMAETDEEVNRVNSAAPHGDYPRLRGTELTARGLDCLMQPDVSITQELRLPNFTRAANEPVLAYPPPVPNLALQVLSAMPSDNFDWKNWHQEFEKRDRILEDNRKQAAEAEQRQREREPVEVRKAKEPDQVALGGR